MLHRRILLALPFALALAIPAAATETDAWRALEAGGHVVVMRHSLDEPGNGDSPGHRFCVCQTERQLIPKGREKARHVGEAFRSRGIVIGIEPLRAVVCKGSPDQAPAFGRSGRCQVYV